MAEVIPEEELSPETLVSAIRKALPRQPSAAAPISLDGARRSVGIAEDIFAPRLVIA